MLDIILLLEMKFLIPSHEVELRLSILPARSLNNPSQRKLIKMLRKRLGKCIFFQIEIFHYSFFQQVPF